MVQLVSFVHSSSLVTAVSSKEVPLFGGVTSGYYRLYVTISYELEVKYENKLV